MRRMRWVLYIALFLCTVWVSRMGYRQVLLVQSEKTVDIGTWLPKKEIVRLMRYHGADVMKVTQDEVYIYRDARWIPVRKRDRG
ncbi:MAG: hypothetical protein H6Q84_933 [Deltaproteobacteria bacterium]|nr:hypothetical protein [Deltaproteobacteria bacterium]